LSAAHLPKRMVGVPLSRPSSPGLQILRSVPHGMTTLADHGEWLEFQVNSVVRVEVTWLTRVEPMQNLPESVVAAVGRMTVAATELEFVLAWIGADQEGGDATKVFAKPGEALRAARGSVEFAPARVRDAFLDAVAEAGDALGASQATLRTMWTEGNTRTEARIDEVVVRLYASRERLGTLIDTQLGSRAGQP
jgi:hypothetical protein